MKYQIVELPEGAGNGYQPYGAAFKLWLCKDHEVIIAGPAETGKTLVCLHKIDAIAWKYPNCQIAIIRKTYKSMPGSVLQTYQDKVLGSDSPVTVYGGTRPERFIYPHGSQVWAGGMDNPDKVLSSERDIIYVNQAEELNLDEWETLTTRCTGRAGNMPWSQILGDCNPSHPQHWILRRASDKVLTLLKSYHKDNPVLYSPETGKLTEQGRRTMIVLNNLTGVRRLRLRDGKWVKAEGTIYEGYDSTVHLIPRFDIPADWRRFRVVDFGYRNPFVCGWWALDYDDRMYLYRQVYMTNRTVAKHAEKINELSESEQIESTICDHDAEDRATLAEHGIHNIPAKKAVSVGIEKVVERLKIQPDGKPRLFVLQDSLVELDQNLVFNKLPTCTEEEFDGYVWATGSKEQPSKVNDHGMDMVRYAVMHVDSGPGKPDIRVLEWKL